MGDKFISWDFISFSMTKRYKKEERLSPKAKELIKAAKNISYFSARYENAATRLARAINPKELNMHDRQKIGRELRRKSKSQFDGSYAGAMIETDYDINGPGTDFDREKQRENWPGRISDKLKGKKDADKRFTYAQESENNGDLLNAFNQYRSAGKGYEDIGLVNKAYTSYENSLNALEQLQKAKDWGSDYERMKKGISSDLDRLKNEKMQRENKKHGGLEKVTATASIVGVLGGIFFLSNNITGNAIANISQSSGNILGAVLLVVGLVAGFFWVKKK